ncbi:MAG: hypothetical protein IE933_15395 [Sphingomonadales bacterium]|nr:hypothetical protein [Sphingomonadales bacterium]MBD3774858.1 hypothetical protein [Paracoccaceae bacterium]
MDIPSLGPDGRRLTVNTGISADERVWYFRSAWNVAALNCTGPDYQAVTDAYGAFIKNNAKALARVNNRIDQTYRKDYSNSRSAIKAREARMTMVYNYFTLPPVRSEFCRAALVVANQSLANPKYDPGEFATTNFSMFEMPFENFFSAYEQYQRDSSAWDAQYGAVYGPSQPGYVAVQAARRAGVPTVGLSDPASTTTQSTRGAGIVTDPDTGAPIPVVPVQEGQQSVPVIQPLPTTSGPSK